MGQFIKTAQEYQDKNLWAKYQSLSVADQQNEGLVTALRQLDLNVNVNWPLVHYKSAVRYLSQDKGDVRATGGTNWQQYLPPRFQKRIFFPALWSEEEQQNWGRQWVLQALKKVSSMGTKVGYALGLFGIVLMMACGNGSPLKESLSEATYQYGIQVDSFTVIKGQVQPGQALGSIYIFTTLITLKLIK